MSNFKVGDRVKCIRGSEANPLLNYAPLKTGEVYVVVDPGEGYNPCIVVKGICISWYEDRFILAEKQ